MKKDSSLLYSQIKGVFGKENAKTLVDFLDPCCPFQLNADGTGNSISNIKTEDISNISKSGLDSTLITGTAGTNGQIAEFNTDGDLVAIDKSSIKPLESFIIACSDETTDLTVGTSKVTFRMPYNFLLREVRASLTTATSGSGLVVDINKEGASILSAKLSIDAEQNTSVIATTPVVISDSNLGDNSQITIDIDSVGSTTAGRGLKVTLIGNRV